LAAHPAPPTRPSFRAGTATDSRIGTMLAGLALGQLFVGPVADAVGRRTPLLAGIALHIVASVLCVVAPNIAVLGVLRVLQ
jgi:MFS family permease